MLFTMFKKGIFCVLVLYVVANSQAQIIEAGKGPVTERVVTDTGSTGLPATFAPVVRYRGMNPRLVHPLGIHVNFGGVGLLGGSIDYFIKPYWDVEVGGGLNGAFMGSHYHFTGIRNIPWTVYAGSHVTYTYEGLWGLYFPGGFQMLQQYGLSFRFEVAVWLRQYKTPPGVINEVVLWGRLAFGYYF